MLGGRADDVGGEVWRLGAPRIRRALRKQGGSGGDQNGTKAAVSVCQWSSSEVPGRPPGSHGVSFPIPPEVQRGRAARVRPPSVLAAFQDARADGAAFTAVKAVEGAPVGGVGAGNAQGRVRDPAAGSANK